MPTATPARAGVPRPEPTHPCVRCGRAVSLDESLCEFCNPLGLSQPATSQAHGTVFVAIVGAVVLLAVAGRLALSGVGPFHGEVANVTSSGTGLEVALTVRNDGSKEGSTTCRVTEASRHGTGPAAVLLTPHVGAGQTLTFSTTVEQFGSAAVPLAVDCHSP
jgi:predicted nucleic acid-binding Zn ribbon protein